MLFRSRLVSQSRYINAIPICNNHPAVNAHLPVPRSPMQHETGQNKIHPTQKPIKLYEWLLMNYAKKGQRILDTHLGSGSSAIAAHYFGVDVVGCELDKDYFEAAKTRFAMATKHLAMSI